MDNRRRYDALTLEEIERYVEEGQEENLYLEFKTIKGSEFRKDDKKI